MSARGVNAFVRPRATCRSRAPGLIRLLLPCCPASWRRRRFVERLDAPAVLYQKALWVGLQLTGAKIVTGSDMELTRLLHPISDFTSNSREQIEPIPSRSQRQFRYVAGHLPAWGE